MPLLIGDIVRDAAAVAPATTAATLGRLRVSFAQLDAQANRLAHVLRGRGVGKGDVVCWWTATSLASLAGLLAVNRLGAVFAPLATQLSSTEAIDVLDYLAPRLVVVDAAQREQCPDGPPVATIGTGGPTDLLTVAAGASSGPVPASATAGIDDADPHILYLTSGSTGRPKGVLVSHRASWLRSAPGGGTFADGLRGDNGVLSSFPLSHYGGWHYVLEAWLNRTAVHLVRRADASELHSAVATHRPTAMYAIPAVWERVLAEPGDLGCLRHADTGTSAFGADLLDRIHARAPDSTSSVLYGATEAGRLAGLRHAQLADRPGSVGRPAFPGVLRLADDGEILFRGPTMMNGYRDLPDDTAKAVRDGWYHTGDLGRCDTDGYYWVTGRKKEIIRTGGEAVAPTEVEAAIRALPGIADVAVIGLPDERWGEIVCAVVVPAAGTACPDLAELRAGLPLLAAFKHPRRVVTVAEIPRTDATGQSMRSRLRRDLLARGAFDGAPADRSASRPMDASTSGLSR